MSQSNSNVAESDSQLNQMILSGQALDGFDKFYADDVVMQEREGEPRVGKAVNRKYEEGFFSSVAEVHEIALHDSAAGDETSFGAWTFDVTFKDGNRVTPLMNGDLAYPEMLAAVDAAEHSVALSSYIFDNDAAGTLFVDALQRAHRRICYLNPP